MLLPRTSLQVHPFLMLFNDSGEEMISAWVRRTLEQIRIMKRFPSNVSLASSSSSTSGWSGLSAHSGKVSSSLGQNYHHMDTT